MYRRTLFPYGIFLIGMALTAGCGSKTPAGAAAEQHDDGVSSVPPAAEREADLSASDLPVGGATKEVKFKVLDKDADDKSKGLMHVKVFALDGPVDITEHTRWEVWKPGSDPDEQKAEMDSWASNESPVPAGTWDVRFVYDEGPIAKAQGWIRNVNVEAGKLWKGEVVLAAPIQYVRLFATLDGKDMADAAHIDVFKAGTDETEFQPLTSFWSTQKQPLAAGSYDFRLTYEKDKVKAKGAVKGLAVGGDRGVLKKTVALGK